MDEPNTDVIQGTLDMLILKTLSLQPMHGFGIARRIEQISRASQVTPDILTALSDSSAPGGSTAVAQREKARRRGLLAHARRPQAAGGEKPDERRCRSSSTAQVRG